MKKPAYYNALSVPGPNDMLVKAVFDAVARLELETATEVDVIAAIDVLDRLKQVTRGLATLVDDAACRWINANHDITVGDCRYYVGTTTWVKCRDPRQALTAMLETSGGDLDAVAACLASDAWKSGASRQLLGEQFDVHFATELREDLKTGKPRKSLQRVNQRFLPAKKEKP